MSSKTIKQILSSLLAIASLERNGNSPGEDQNQNSNECLVGASDALCDCLYQKQTLKILIKTTFQVVVALKEMMNVVRRILS